MVVQDTHFRPVKCKATESCKNFIRGCAQGALPNVCFTGNTLVRTDKGLIPIMDIKVGDLVYSFDTEKEEMEYKSITKLFPNFSHQLVYITIGRETIETTPSHPFYLDSIGWVRAGDLSIGDKLKLSSQETAAIGGIEKIDFITPIAVYNFTVDGYNTYFVSELKVLVHNRCR